MIKKNIFAGLFLLAMIVLLSNFFSAYMVSSNAQTTQFFSTVLQTVSPVTCQKGNDFLIQIAPFGCTPDPVTSDLLEDNDVPITCQLAATQINPLVQVNSIDSVSFSGQLPKEVSGVGFYPAQAALGVQGALNSPALNNIGYVQIMLKQQTNDSAMPAYVSGNLTAKITYNLNNAFGVGTSLFYLPELNDADFANTISQYTFWNGKGYLRADSISANSAAISIYTDTGKVGTVNLNQGQTSDVVYLPGLQCQAGIKLKLESLDNPNSRAQLRIDGEVNNVAVGETFLNNKCDVRDLKNYGVMQQVTMRCQEDSGANTFSLTISPNITLDLGSAGKKSFQLGDKVYSNGANNVYLAYIGTKGNSRDSKDLFVYFLSSPTEKNSKLSDDKITSLSHLFGDLINANVNSGTVIDQAAGALKSSAGLMNLAYKFLAGGEQTTWIGVSSQNPVIFGTPVSLVGFTGPQDIVLDTKVQDQYNSAMKDYDAIVSQYPSETTSAGTTYGEEALYDEIIFSSNAGQKRTAADFCQKFIQNYPHSTKSLTSYCNDYQLANGQAQSADVTINKQIKQISFDGIYEPSFNDYGVVVQASTPQGSDSFSLKKDQPEYLSSGNGFMQLVSINNDSSANVLISVVTDSGTVSNTVKLIKNSPSDFAKGYSFTLSQVKLTKVAKVSVTSSLDNTGTSANFSFKIGIEQRAIQLSPEQIRMQIKQLNESIKTWQGISDTVNNASQDLKTVCLAAGAIMVVKNLLLNPGVSGLARQSVMTGTNGWDTKCAALVAKGTYISKDACFTQNAGKIDADVKTVSDAMDAQTADKKKLEATPGVTSSDWLGDKTVDTKKYMMQSDIPVVNPYLKSNLPSTFTDPSGKGQAIDVTNLLTNVITPDGYNKSIFTSDQLNDIELWTKISKDPSSSPDLVSLANSRLYSDLSGLQTSAANYAQIAQTASGTSIDTSKIGFIPVGKDTTKYSYLGLTNGDLGTKKISGIDDKTPVYLAPASDGNTYVFVLDDSSGTQNLPVKLTGDGKQIYNYNNGELVTSSSPVYSDLTKIYFQKFDASSYKNPYKNAKLTYFETDPYKGMPAIVPFDLQNGWYADVKPNVPVGGTTASYETNGRVTSFYVCNVGANGLEENTGGDDVCELINTATGQPYTQFPGITDTTQATAIINKANQAIEAASKIPEAQRNGYVSIMGQKVQVGAPATTTSQFQCQDFMSPSDCAILFNLCDPVICPTSRCDLGGTYPVQDVVQTGIIGSIVLCAPNFVGFGGTDYFPVCLTGIGAGVDSFLSTQKSYMSCLQESLATGKQVGICDEIYSIYLCDFFWKQALPLANMVIPKALAAIAGQNVRGGGEYLGVQSAWDNAQKSLNYFINYYGANANQAFSARSTDIIQDEVCKLFTSANVPSGADLLSSMTAPESPVQFTANFEETPFSSATSPPTSHYKVFYNIYAGKDSGVYYQVYLKGDLTSSYYKDTASNLMIASGYIAAGGYATDTPDKLATSGYKQLCVNVNGQEECGFSEVSTSFAVNYVKDEYLASEANQTGITSSSECISGSPSAYSLLNTNVQSAAQSIVDPAIYDQGIIRICSTANPGQGTDPNAGNSNARWVEVGYCDTANVKCWIDTQSVANVIKSTSIQNSTLSSLSSSEAAILANQNGYLTKPQFATDVTTITQEPDAGRKITLINNIIDITFWSNQKAQLLLLRGDAYSTLFATIFATLPKPTPATINPAAPTEGLTGGGPQTTPGETTTPGTETQTTSAPVLSQAQILAVSDPGERMVDAANALQGTIVPGDDSNRGYRYTDNCWTAAVYSYVYAGVSQRSCGYADVVGTTYAFSNEHTKGQTVSVTIGTTMRGGVIVASGVSSGTCTLDSKASSAAKLDAIQPGYLLSILWDGQWGHNVVFLGWADKDKRIANLFDWNGNIITSGSTSPSGQTCSTKDLMGSTSKYCKTYRIYQADLNDNANPVFMYWPPYLPSASAQVSIPTAPKQTFAPPDVTNTVASSTSNNVASRGTMREKIYAAAMDIANTGDSPNINDVDAKFVSRALVNAGVTGINVAGTVSLTLPTSTSYLTSLFDANSNFKQVDVSTLEIGDIVILGQGCTEPASIGIVEVAPAGAQPLYIYTNLGSKVKTESINFLSAIDNGWYVYKAYRYVGDTKETVTARTKWTLIDAVNKANTLTGSYTDNKLFIDQLIFDGLLTTSECGDVRGTSSFFGSLGGAVLQKDMSWLKKLLIVKCGQDSLCLKLYQK